MLEKNIQIDKKQTEEKLIVAKVREPISDIYKGEDTRFEFEEYEKKLDGQSGRNFRNALNEIGTENIKYRNEVLDALCVAGVGEKDRNSMIEAYFDPDTHILNRIGLRFLEEMVVQKKSGISILMFDADHFKSFDQNLGSVFTDFLIEVIAKNMNEVVGNLKKAGYQNLYLVRLGGEELTIFGEVPAEELKAEMSKASIKIQSDIKKYISDDLLEYLAKEIYTNKYQGSEKTIVDVLAEVAGSTIAITNNDFQEYHKNLCASTKKLASYALKSADDYLMFLKEKRGVVEIDRRKRFDIKDEREIESSDTERRKANFMDKINKGVSDNYDDNQKNNLHLFSEKMIEKVLEGRKNKLSYYYDIQSLNITEEQKGELFNYLEKLKWSNDELLTMAEEYGLNVNDLIRMKRERVRFDSEDYTYSGAHTILYLKRFLNNEKSKFTRKNTYKIEIGAFKSFNETVGHFYADSYITYIYQEVIKKVINEDKKLELDKDVIVSQKGANFYISFARSVLEGEKLLTMMTLKKKYREKIEEYFSLIDAGSKNSSENIREDWILINQSGSVPFLKELLVNYKY